MDLKVFQKAYKTQHNQTKNKFQYTYFAFGVGLGSGLIGVVSPRQLKQSH
jgi:hypothetical protein